MIGWRRNSWNPERVPSVVTLCVCEGLEISGCTGARCTQKFGCAPKFLKLGARRAPSNFNTVILLKSIVPTIKKHLKLNVFKTLSIHDFQPTPIRFKSVYLWKTMTMERTALPLQTLYAMVECLASQCHYTWMHGQVKDVVESKKGVLPIEYTPYFDTGFS